MFKVTSKRDINGVKLGDKRSIVEQNPEAGGLKIDYKNDRVSSISFYDATKFELDGKLIHNFTVWLNKENPFFDDGCLIFPDLNIATYQIENPKHKYEFTLYAQEVEELYEANLNSAQRYNQISEIK